MNQTSVEKFWRRLEIVADTVNPDPDEWAFVGVSARNLVLSGTVEVQFQDYRSLRNCVIDINFSDLCIPDHGLTRGERAEQLRLDGVTIEDARAILDREYATQ